VPGVTRANRYKLELNMKTASAVLLLAAVPALLFGAGKVRTESGVVETGKTASGVRAFLGIPFAAPPTGDLRWRAPQPVKPWKGVRKANEFGARCMQRQVFADMIFRDPGPSEDCLTLNVWTAAKDAKAKLPVMVWIFGGGFQAGAVSEPRQDGTMLARKGVVVVSMNYRLGVFGFFSHPELTAESEHKASGNQGLLDQTAALQWVKRNIAAFGGDPANVTIFGESAGSFSVSAQVASPLAKGLFHKAIGESGAAIGGGLSAGALTESEAAGKKFGESQNAPTLAALRAIPGTELLEKTAKGPRFGINIDGYFLPASANEIYRQGRQSPVPLLAGWNADESNARGIFGQGPQTAAALADVIRKRFPDHAEKLIAVYSATTDDEAKRAAADLAGDQFIALGTWRWLEAQTALPNAPGVWRYQFDQAPPPEKAGAASRGAYHSAEIEFVFGVLDSKKLPWREEDRKVSAMMVDYWSNFAKKGDPNGPGLPPWPAYNGSAKRPVMHIKVTPEVTEDDGRARYEALQAASDAASRSSAAR